MNALGQHLGSEADARRDAMLAGRGLMTLRLENDDVTDDIDAVCARILAAAKLRLASPLVQGNRI